MTEAGMILPVGDDHVDVRGDGGEPLEEAGVRSGS